MLDLQLTLGFGRGIQCASIANHFFLSKAFLSADNCQNCASVTTGCSVSDECANFLNGYVVGNNIVKERYDQVLLICVPLAILKRWNILIQLCPHHLICASPSEKFFLLRCCKKLFLWMHTTEFGYERQDYIKLWAANYYLMYTVNTDDGSLDP